MGWSFTAIDFSDNRIDSGLSLATGASYGSFDFIFIFINRMQVFGHWGRNVNDNTEQYIFDNSCTQSNTKELYIQST